MLLITIELPLPPDFYRWNDAGRTAWIRDRVEERAAIDGVVVWSSRQTGCWRTVLGIRFEIKADQGSLF
jgi:hypothetical protein